MTCNNNSGYNETLKELDERVRTTKSETLKKLNQHNDKTDSNIETEHWRGSITRMERTPNGVLRRLRLRRIIDYWLVFYLLFISLFISFRSKQNKHLSNYGGVWERHIHTARGILSGMLKVHGENLHEESFHTLLCEIQNIINSRPLIVDNLNDPSTLKLISPMTLLTQKSKVVYPWPGRFENADIYSRKHWRRVQHLVNDFWERWRKEYLNSLQ